ncbi:MAG: asparagine synthase-related protein, partial [Thermoplasmata archaeon]
MVYSATSSGPVGESLRELVAQFDSSVERSLSGCGRTTLLWSAGLDSSLVAWSGRHFAHLAALTLGTEGSHDLRKARQLHSLLDIPWEEHIIDSGDVRRVRRSWGEELDGLREPVRSVVVATILGLESSPERSVVWGQGADELFFGYAHFRRLTLEEAQARQRLDLARLLDFEWPRAQRIAESLGHDL